MTLPSTEVTPPVNVVQVHLTEAGEYAFYLPDGTVAFVSELRPAALKMLALHDRGFRVYFEGEPLIPQHGFWGWFHRQLDKLIHWKNSRRYM